MKNVKSWDSGMAQSVKCVTPDFGSGHVLGVARSNSGLGSTLSVEFASYSLSLSKNKLKIFLKKFKN